MKEYYKKSLQMIKICKIKSKKEYIKLSKNFLVLNIESLKYISERKNFKEIVKLANAM